MMRTAFAHRSSANSMDDADKKGDGGERNSREIARLKSRHAVPIYLQTRNLRLSPHMIVGEEEGGVSAQ